ncbi:MAG TPA: 50S ribosomal protein L24 [Nitrososphaerales archaeon]|nr:50S ribosomal protein L24 [Nitrososphaerales archaeon]
MRFGSMLSTELREKYKRKTVRPREGDSVRIVRGEFKGIEGKVTKVSPHEGTLNVEGVTREKQKGGTSPVPIPSSNVLVTAVFVEDKIRKSRLEASE